MRVRKILEIVNLNDCDKYEKIMEKKKQVNRSSAQKTPVKEEKNIVRLKAVLKRDVEKLESPQRYFKGK